MIIYHLREPSERYADQIREYRMAFLKSHSSMDGTSFLAETEDPLQWIDLQRRLSKEETVPENLVPSKQYLYIRDADDRLVGMISIRLRLNDYLKKCGGHIGYSVLPEERNRGIAKQMLRDALEVCREKNINPVLLTCHQTNTASRKVILSCGGEFDGYTGKDDGIVERYWIHL